jgi:uncharacterized membrane protein
MNNQIDEGKQAAIVSYLTIIGTVIAIFMNNESKNPFASYHIRQALGINITYFLLGYFIGYFDSWMISSAFWLFVFILWIYGFIAAIQGEYKKVPLVGDFYQNILKSVS